MLVLAATAYSASAMFNKTDLASAASFSAHKYHHSWVAQSAAPVEVSLFEKQPEELAKLPVLIKPEKREDQQLTINNLTITVSQPVVSPGEISIPVKYELPDGKELAIIDMWLEIGGELIHWDRGKLLSGHKLSLEGKPQAVNFNQGKMDTTLPKNPSPWHLKYEYTFSVPETIPLQWPMTLCIERLQEIGREGIELDPEYQKAVQAELDQIAPGITFEAIEYVTAFFPKTWPKDMTEAEAQKHIADAQMRVSDLQVIEGPWIFTLVE